jgi:sulfur carrier protein
MPMQITLNGQARSFDGPLSVAGLLTASGLAGRKVAVELNGEVVPRSAHDAQPVLDGDRVEIIQAIGGG